jgi:hypothetical protein
MANSLIDRWTSVDDIEVKGTAVCGKMHVRARLSICLLIHRYPLHRFLLGKTEPLRRPSPQAVRISYSRLCTTSAIRCYWLSVVQQCGSPSIGVSFLKARNSCLNCVFALCHYSFSDGLSACFFRDRLFPIPCVLLHVFL